jgi:hypothetical protein
MRFDRARRLIWALALAGCSGSGPVVPDGKGLDGRSLDGVPVQGDRASSDLGWRSDLTPPPGCSTAPTLTLVQGRALVTGTTAGLPAGPSSVKCGYCASLVGPQAYYRIDLTQNIYNIYFLASFSGMIYVFDQGCDPAAIDAACSKLGMQQLFFAGPIPAGSPSSGHCALFSLRPPKTGTYYLAVGSTDPAHDGAFALEIVDVGPTGGECVGGCCGTPGGPSGQSCLGPQVLTSAKQTLTGTTARYTNENGTSVTCGGSDAMSGPQRYYSIPLQAGQSYTFDFTPQYDFARLYLWAGGCDPSQVNAGCGSGGSKGFVTQPTPAGVQVSATFTPPSTGNYILAADSSCATAYGPFTVTIK